MKRKKLLSILSLTVLLTACSNQLTVGPGTAANNSQTKNTVNTTTPETKSTNPATSVTAPVTTPSTTTPPATMGNHEAFMDGISIGGVNVSGLPVEKAREKVSAEMAKAQAQLLVVKSPKETFEFPQSDVGISFNLDQAMKDAEEFMAKLSQEDKVKFVEEGKKKYIDLEAKADEEKLSTKVSEIAQKVEVKPEGDNAGTSMDEEQLKKDLRKALGLIDADNTINIATATIYMDEDKAKDASNGAVVAGEKELGRGTSEFDEDFYPRAFNVKKAAKSLDGVVVKPGEEFSFNDTVGAASKKNGYKKAVVYAGGGMAEGYGGGVCQVSSTLYNAIIKSGFKTSERHTHRFIVSYLPSGFDAAIYNPGLDLKFKNTYKNPITIHSSSKNGVLKFWITGEGSDKGGYTYKFVRKNYKAKKNQWDITYTDKLKKGKSKITGWPIPEISVDVYRVTYLNGKKVKSELFTQNSYEPLVGKKLVGR